ncbi:uncharacterized protein BX664DRAFT_78968 [Halteromyces radiatus]|uniref:uncharacterized protein n=1 Tax=Halteromyces radiatus TaxID=101107 RepID=UPI0022211016|nr:uncharacterized protein BX664DRAFT_78968 [Halteromyces radiatus]KAI8097378.1 hypothetical protein BX664DRAFT_78968 [Halteromyces radiatus]
MHPHFRTLLNEMPDIYDSIWRWDCVLYDSLIVDLLPEVDTPTSNHMMSGLRQYTRSLPQFLQQLLKDYPQALRQKKCDVANIFVAKIRRQLTLNQFAIATGKILGRPDLLGAMKTDWEQLDVGIVLDHVLWVCDCRNNDMRQILEKDLVRLLTVGTTLDQWMKWEEQLLDKFVPATPKIRDIQDIEKYLAMAKQFVLKWKTYTGLIMQHFYMKNIGSIGKWKKEKRKR